MTNIPFYRIAFSTSSFSSIDMPEGMMASHPFSMQTFAWKYINNDDEVDRDYFGKIIFPYFNAEEAVDDFNTNDYNLPCGFFASQKGYDFLRPFKVPGHYCFDLSYKRHGIIQKHHFVFLYESMRPYINFEKSTFYLSETFPSERRIEHIPVTSYEEFRQQLKKAQQLTSDQGKSLYVCPASICLEIDPDDFYDIIPLGVRSYDIYISERLRQALINSQLTGIYRISESKINFIRSYPFT